MDKSELNQLPQLDDQAASNIMNSVFEACGQKPSNVPLSVLSSYAEYRLDRFALQKRILILILIVFLFLPLFMIAPRVTVSEIARTETGVPTYEITVRNLLPIQSVRAKLDNRAIAVYESDDNIFTVEPGENGHLAVTVTLSNRQYTLWQTEVTGIDAIAPSLVSSEQSDGNVVIYLKDEGVGVSFAECYAIQANGFRIAPVEWSDEDGSIVFPLSQDLNIYILDRNGNTLQLVLTVQQ